MRPSALVRLALAGTRTDGLRVLLTAFSAALATLAVLAALTVLAVATPAGGDPRAESEQYTNALLREPGLRPGVAFALVLLTIPVLALAGQCARLGAPARDRRLAAFRLAGATPGQVIAVVAAETGIAGLLGSVAGLGVHLAGRQLLDRPGPDGRLALPTDVLPHPAAVTAVVLGLPLAATLAAAVMLRRVSVTPFAVVRKVRRERAPGPWPGVLIGLGVAAFAAVKPVGEWYARRGEAPSAGLLLTLLAGGGLVAMAGVVLGAGWISYVTGRLLHRVARRPGALLAARRLIADPWAGSRTFAALLAAVIFGAGAAGFRAMFAALAEAQAESERRLNALAGSSTPVAVDGDDFYLRTMDLVDSAVLVALVIAAAGLLVAVAEGIVSRRRAYAALVATGVPRSVLGRAVAWQALAPAVPAILLALAVGACLARGITRGEARAGSAGRGICDAGPQLCDTPATAARYTRVIEVPEIVRSVPVAFDDLALYGAVALAAVLATVGIGLLFLRSSTTVEELRVG